MQSVEIQGLDKVTKALEDMPGAVREARAVVFEEMGGELLGAVQQRIGGSGRVARRPGVPGGQRKRLCCRPGQGKDLLGRLCGRVYHQCPGRWTQSAPAFRSRFPPRAKTDRVPGKYMYRDTGQFEAERLAETAAQRIEDAALQKLNGGFG